MEAWTSTSSAHHPVEQFDFSEIAVRLSSWYVYLERCSHSPPPLCYAGGLITICLFQAPQSPHSHLRSLWTSLQIDVRGSQFLQWRLSLLPEA